MGGPALNLGLATALLERVREVRFTLLSKYPEDDAGPCAEMGWGCARYPTGTQIFLGLPFALFYRLLRMMGVPESAMARGPLRAYLDADVVADLSGISFSDARPLSGLLINSLWLVPALAAGTPYVKVSQAMGPFRRRPVRWAARFLLGRASGLVARGPTTAQHLRHLLPESEVHTLPDVAFAMNTAPAASVDAAIATLGLGPNEAFCAAGPSAVVDDLMTAGATPDAYAHLMARAVDELAELSGLRVLLVPHARATVRNRQDDLEACEAVLRFVRHRDRLVVARDRFPAPLLKGMVGRAEVAVGSRFHFIVAALGTGVPALAIGWSHKYREMMSMLGQEDYAIGHEAADEEAVVGRVRALWANRTAIRNRLAEVLPAVRREASRNAEIVLNAIGQS